MLLHIVNILFIMVLIMFLILQKKEKIMEKNTSKRTAALVLSIIGLVIRVISLFLLYFIALIALPLGIIAIVLSAKSDKEGVPATGGLVMGILTVVFSGISIACWVACAEVASNL